MMQRLGDGPHLLVCHDAAMVRCKWGMNYASSCRIRPYHGDYSDSLNWVVKLQ